MCVEGLKRSPDKPSNNVYGEGGMKGKVKKKSESNLAKSSTSLWRGLPGAKKQSLGGADKASRAINSRPPSIGATQEASIANAHLPSQTS